MGIKAFEVRESTSDHINKKLDAEIETRVKYFSLKGKKDITERIRELDDEWDIERLLSLNAASLALTGIGLALLHDKKWLILSSIVAGFLIQHSVQGWCPPITVFRRMGVRTRQEIEKEKNALKAVRGDFKEASDEKDDIDKAEKALSAVNDY